MVYPCGFSVASLDLLVLLYTMMKADYNACREGHPLIKEVTTLSECVEGRQGYAWCLSMCKWLH